MLCCFLFYSVLHCFTRCQNCPLPLSSSKARLSSRQTSICWFFAIFSNMYLIVYDDGHVVVAERYRGSTLFLLIEQKIQNFFRCNTRSLRSRVLSVTTTITGTSHGCHIIRDPLHAIMARKEISIKFSSMGKCVSEFI